MKRWLIILLTAGLGLVFFAQLSPMLNQGDARSGGSVAAMPAMTIIDLGTLGGSTSSALDINQQGIVVGNSTLTPTLQTRGFQWESGAMVPLSVSADLPTYARAINEDDLIAGSVISADGESNSEWPVIWHDVGHTLLATNGPATAMDINNDGVVVGHTLEDVQNRILIWTGQTLSQSIDIEDGQVLVHAVNNHLQIVGQLDDGAGNSAFMWHDGGFEDLGTLGGQNSMAFDLNDTGQVVGSASVIEDLAMHAFLWEDGEMQDLGTLGDEFGANSRALGINNRGEIVGEVLFGEASRAVMWTGDGLVDLNGYLPPSSPWELLQSAVSINDKGWITGTGIIDGETHAFLLQPQPGSERVYLPVVAVPEAEPTPAPTPTIPPTSSPTPDPTPPTTGYDLHRYISGDGRLYEVRLKRADGSEAQARHQTQFQSFRFYHTKGSEISAEWEELWSDNYYIYRATDTSPGSGLYYTLYESRDQYLAGNPGSRWAHRYMWPGDLYFRQPYVVFFRKSDCGLVVGGQYTDNSWLKFQAFHRYYTFDSGITLTNVVELAWLPGDENGPTQAVDERYFYAENFGLVGWKKPSIGWASEVIEIFQSGERPDNKREFIPCMNQAQFLPQSWRPELLDGPLPEPYASMVRP